jgi:hypothetical protein
LLNIWPGFRPESIVPVINPFEILRRIELCIPPAIWFELQQALKNDSGDYLFSTNIQVLVGFARAYSYPE